MIYYIWLVLNNINASRKFSRINVIIDSNLVEINVYNMSNEFFKNVFLINSKNLKFLSRFQKSKFMLIAQRKE